MTDRRKRVKTAGTTPRETNQDPRRLRRRRVAAGMYLTTLAALAMISPGYLSELERGTYSASPEVLGRLAAALSCGIEDLMRAESAAPAA